MIAAERYDPSPTVMRGGRPVHVSRNFGDLRGSPGPPKISDFGLAVESHNLHHHSIQPDLFQAPEVILRAGWSTSADIWNLGVMVGNLLPSNPTLLTTDITIWDLMEGRSLFRAGEAAHSTYTENAHLQEMLSLLGPLPVQLLLRGEYTKQYFTTTVKGFTSLLLTSRIQVLRPR